MKGIQLAWKCFSKNLTLCRCLVFPQLNNLTLIPDKLFRKQQQQIIKTSCPSNCNPRNCILVHISDFNLPGEFWFATNCLYNLKGTFYFPTKLISFIQEIVSL